MVEPERRVQEESQSFFADVLKPGSSFHPTFLAIVDVAFAFLLVVLLSLAFITSGNIHLIFLTLIELALWASVKWFVHELNKAQVNMNQDTDLKIQGSRAKEE